MEKPKSARALYKKGGMAVLALLLLVSAVVYLTTAWYTKMVSTSGMAFEAAQWDFTANYAVDSIAVNVFDYGTLENGKAAPGSAGYIPVKLSAQQSETAISYQLTVSRDTMSEDFRDRIFFFYYREVTVEGQENPTQEKVYFGASPEDPTNDEEIVMEGDIAPGGDTIVYVYWEWIYEAPAPPTDPGENASAEEKAEYEAALAEYEKNKDKYAVWDEFDTNVGKNPDIYVGDMNATITVAGVEVNHEAQAAGNNNNAS